MSSRYTLGLEAALARQSPLKMLGFEGFELIQAP